MIEAPARSGRGLPFSCDRFRSDGNGPEQGPKLKEVGSWMQDTYIETGRATFPGMTAPDRGVAQACANLRTALLG